MQAKSLSLQNIGQLADVNVKFGDLTVIVGPQATGKSIFLQLFKLALDAGYITSRLKREGLDWGKDFGQFLYAYLGEGMEKTWDSGKSEMILDQKRLDPRRLISTSAIESESLYYIPAQRVMMFPSGWPSLFSDFSSPSAVPFVMRSFGDNIFRFLELDYFQSTPAFRLEPVVQEILNDAIFNGAELLPDRKGIQKRLILKVGNEKLPFMVWSAGQREFVPLLLGAFQLFPAVKTRRLKEVDWVVIEEPEAGLHPRAIYGVMLLVLEMLHRGYKVVLSTHSNQVLDVLWVFGIIQAYHGAPEKILDLFQIPQDDSMKKLAAKVSKKDFRVYYFDPTDRGVISRDISSLDPGSEDNKISGWGGLSEFSGHAADIVSDVVRSSCKVVNS